MSSTTALLAVAWMLAILGLLALAAVAMAAGRRRAELDLRGVPAEER